MAKVLREKIYSLDRLAPDIFKMTIKSDYIAQNAKPGQFVNVKCSEGLNALLRRPISICNINSELGLLDIVFQIKGIGTEYLSQKQIGAEVDIIAPLGKEFEISNEYKRISVVGGGIGVFPLLYLLNKCEDTFKTAYLGFRNKEYIVLKNEFINATNKLEISTDDGSEGYEGLVTDILERDLKENRPDIIYTCGPMPMIKKVVELASKYEVKCQVSLEQRMGCGIGACLVCACKTRLGDEWEYSHVCKDGPVFWSNEVIFDG